MDSSTLFDVKGKVVLVTGGAKGIGRMISEGYVKNGAKVYITSRDAKACDAAVKELNAMGPGSAASIPADFYKEADVKRLAKEFATREKSTPVCSTSPRELRTNANFQNSTSSSTTRAATGASHTKIIQRPLGSAC